MSLMIEGGRRLSGDLTVQGAKNSVLPILAAAVTDFLASALIFVNTYRTIHKNI